MEQDQIECHFDGSFLAWVPDDENSIMMEITKLIRILDASRFDKFLVSAKMSLDEVPSEEENTSYGRERIRHAKMAAAQAKMAQNMMKATATSNGGAGGGGGGGGGIIGVMANAPNRPDAGRILDRIRQKQFEASTTEIAEVMREAYDLRKSLKENKPKKKAWWQW